MPSLATLPTTTATHSNSKVKGQAQVAGVFNVPGPNPSTEFARLIVQTYKTKTGYFLAAQFFNADGTPQTVAFPPTGSLGKFILKQDLGLSQGSALTTPIASQVAATCGFQSINA